MSFTEGERKALLASAILVLLAALSRSLLEVPGPEVQAVGLSPAGGLDSALAVAESLHAESVRRKRPLAPGERIDPNTASEVELDRLPGVGPALARAIARNREAAGPFRRSADLERVPGIGRRTSERLTPFLTLPPGLGDEERVGEGVEVAAVTGASPLDLNRATAAELDRLPGVGPVRAGAIVRYRREHGPFRRLEDLLLVPGIGPTTLERLRGQVVCGP